jgi:hypothetical protein
MLAALLLGQASAEGAQFFQPPVAGFLSQSSMVSPAVPVPMVPLSGNGMPLQFAEPVPYLVTDLSEEDASDQSVTYSASFAVCALAVAGAAMRKPILKTSRARGNGPPRMSENEDDEMGYSSGRMVHGPAHQVLRDRTRAYVVIFNKGTPNEGVYTLEQRVNGSNVSHVLTFETAEDAGRFAQLLQGEDFNVVGRGSSVSLDAQPLAWDTRSIAQFCQRSAFEVALVPHGGKLTPPRSNTYDPSKFDSSAPSSQAQRFQPRSGDSAQWRTPAFDRYARGIDQRRRARAILDNTNKKTNNRQRGQEVWDAAMRNAFRQANSVPTEEMCGEERGEECGLDQHMGERDTFERLFGPRSDVTNRKTMRQRGQTVWDAAMRNAEARNQANNQANSGEDMCGIEECGLDKHLGERDTFERLLGPGLDGPGPFGPDGPGPNGPGPDGPGPDGPGPWGPRPGPWGP